MKKTLLPLLALCCLTPVAAFAGHPLATDSATTVEERKLEAETAVEYLWNDADGVKTKKVFIQETITAGIVPRIDAFISLPYTYVSPSIGDSEKGFNDITIGVKWNFTKVGNVDLGIKPMMTFASGDEKSSYGFGTGKSSFGALLAASTEFDKKIGVHANLMLMHQQAPEGKSAYNTYTLSAAGTYEATKELKIVAEVAGSRPDYDGAKWATNLTVGGVYAVKEDMDIDLGIRYGLTKDTTEDFGALAGVTFKF